MPASKSKDTGKGRFAYEGLDRVIHEKARLGVLTSLVRADGLLVVPAGTEGHHAGERVSVELLRGPAEIDRTIVAIGSHDLVLDLAASRLRAADPLLTLASSNVGSLGGLVALRDGLCHLGCCWVLLAGCCRV